MSFKVNKKFQNIHIDNEKWLHPLKMLLEDAIQDD